MKDSSHPSVCFRKGKLLLLLMHYQDCSVGKMKVNSWGEGEDVDYPVYLDVITVVKGILGGGGRGRGRGGSL